MPAPPATLGDYIRQKRTAARMSQERLAAMVDTAQHVVSAYEHNKRTPSGPMLALLAARLPGVDAAEMLALIAHPRTASGDGEGESPGPAAGGSPISP